MSGALYWLASYPKSGNTWFRAFMSNLKGEEDRPEDEADAPASINDLSTGAIASSRGWLDSVLNFDTAELSTEEIANLRPAVYGWEARESKTVSHHKIHDACHRGPSGDWLINMDATAGAFYLIRNPLDVAISYANHMHCTIDKAIDRMADPEHRLARDRGQSLGNQVEQWLSTWSEHVVSWVDNPALRTHVMRYEDMKATPEVVFAQAAAFLELDTDPQAIARALRHSDFSTLQSQESQEPFRERNPRSPRFFRKGVAGDWQQTLDPAQIDRILDSHAATMRRFGYCDEAGNPQVM